MFTQHLLRCWQGTPISNKLDVESFKATLGNLAYQVQLAALNMKKTELAALFHSSLIKGFEF